MNVSVRKSIKMATMQRKQLFNYIGFARVLSWQRQIMNSFWDAFNH